MAEAAGLLGLTAQRPDQVRRRCSRPRRRDRGPGEDEPLALRQVLRLSGTDCLTCTWRSLCSLENARGRNSVDLSNPSLIDAGHGRTRAEWRHRSRARRPTAAMPHQRYGTSPHPRSPTRHTGRPGGGPVPGGRGGHRNSTRQLPAVRAHLDRGRERQRAATDSGAGQSGVSHNDPSGNGTPLHLVADTPNCQRPATRLSLEGTMRASPRCRLGP
jgi:hypothetical protein